MLDLTDSFSTRIPPALVIDDLLMDIKRDDGRGIREYKEKFTERLKEFIISNSTEEIDYGKESSNSVIAFVNKKRINSEQLTGVENNKIELLFIGKKYLAILLNLAVKFKIDINAEGYSIKFKPKYNKNLQEVLNRGIKLHEKYARLILLSDIEITGKEVKYKKEIYDETNYIDNYIPNWFNSIRNSGYELLERMKMEALGLSVFTDMARVPAIVSSYPTLKAINTFRLNSSNKDALNIVYVDSMEGECFVYYNLKHISRNLVESLNNKIVAISGKDVDNTCGISFVRDIIKGTEEYLVLTLWHSRTENYNFPPISTKLTHYPVSCLLYTESDELVVKTIDKYLIIKDDILDKEKKDKILEKLKSYKDENSKPKRLISIREMIQGGVI